jgi:hypothetical protein
LPIVLVHLRSPPNIENVLQGQRVNSKVLPQSLKEFRITKAIYIDPTYFVILEAGQKVIDRLDLPFLDGVRVILSQRHYRLPALIFRRQDQRSRRSARRGIS